MASLERQPHRYKRLAPYAVVARCRAQGHPGGISPTSCRRAGAHCRPLHPASLSLCSVWRL